MRKTELAIKKIQKAKEKAEKVEDEIETKILQDKMAAPKNKQKRKKRHPKMK